MKPLVLAALLLVPAASLAQGDPIAAAREAYAEVEKRLPGMARVDFSMRAGADEFASGARAWLEGREVRKVQAVAKDDDGEVVTDYYFARGALVFAFRAVKGWREDRKLATRVEHRQYFGGGKMVRWLGGLEKAAVPASDADYAPEGRARLREAADFVRGARLVAGKRATATVDRLVNGDAACYVEGRDEAGRPFSEPGDFELCSMKPSPAGRRVRLAWGLAQVQSAACQGDPACTKSDTVAIVTAMEVLDGPAPPPAAPR